MDLTRVGIFGTSAGGQSAAGGGALFHPEFYKGAVANCGCHDNRLDKASWNEQWMGYMPPDKLWKPGPDNWYSQSSNIDNAGQAGRQAVAHRGRNGRQRAAGIHHAFRGRADQGAGRTSSCWSCPARTTARPARSRSGKTHDFFVRNLLDQEPADEDAASAGGGSN